MDSFYVGRCWNPETGQLGRRVTFDLASIAHMTLIGPTSCGKGATIELPNLLGDGLRNCNVISFDPTGQNLMVSGRWRGSFSDVLTLNPFHLHGGQDVGCNPLLSVETFEEAMAVGEAMLEVRPDAREPFFNESAQGLIAGVVLAVVKDCKARKLTPTLMKVRKILTDDLEGFAAMMAQSGDFQLASLLGRFQKENRTVDSIKQTADNASKWLLSAEIQKSLAVSDGIDWAQLKHGRRPLSAFVVLDADKLVTFSPWLRLVLISALNTLYRLGGGGRKSVFMLSEMAALGKLQPVIAGLGQGRKYDIRFVPMVIQNPSQLSAIYGRDDAGTVIGNSGCLLGFAPAPVDNESAEFLSRAAGTHWVPDIRASNDPQGGRSRIDVSMREERIWPSDKIRTLPAFHALVWRTGQARPQPVYCAPYWTMPELKGRWDSDPYHPSSAQPARAVFGRGWLSRIAGAASAMLSAAVVVTSAWAFTPALATEILAIARRFIAKMVELI